MKLCCFSSSVLGFFDLATHLLDSFILLEHINSFFLFIAVYCFIAWIYHNLFLHLPDDGYLGQFQFEAIMDKAPLNILVQDILWTYSFISFE